MKRPLLEKKFESYLSLRESLGIPIQSPMILQDFVEYLDRQDRRASITAQVVLDWVCDKPYGRGVSAQYARIHLARGFLHYLKPSFSDIEIPGTGLIAKPHRSTPYVFSNNELVDLLRAAGEPSLKSRIFPYSLQTLLGVMASTGLRSGEAIKLQISDCHLDGTVPRLLIRRAKNDKTRWVPVHATTADRLRHYARWRLGIKDRGQADRLFITKRVQGIHRIALWRIFHELVQRLGIVARAGQARPTLHSLRHSFAVHRLRSWYEGGADVHSMLPSLSVYLGHECLAASYWYLTATPELMNAASQRFQNYVESGDAI